MYVVAPFSAGYVFNWSRECNGIMGQKTNYLGMKKMVTEQTDLGDDGNYDYEDDAGVWIPNPKDYARKVLEAAERRDSDANRQAE